MGDPLGAQTNGAPGADGWVRVSTLDELQRDGVRVLPVGRAAVAVFHDDGRISALDNRCPHLGFPLHRGTVRDGVLTCHWHHAKFDLAGGCTFDPFADDAVPYPVTVIDDIVWVSSTPVARDRLEYHLTKLGAGLERRLSLVLAKSVLGLDGVAPPQMLLERAAGFAVANRREGWSPGLTILVALANVLPALDPADRPLALYHGLVHVARDTAGHAPGFELDPLATSERRPERLASWFRTFCDRRADSAAERTLRTAVDAGLEPAQLAGMVLAASTDHRFINGGHTLDFANKAFELLDHVGWERASEMLPALIPAITGGQRMEETSSWRHPLDVAGLVAEHAAMLDPPPAEQQVAWDAHAELAVAVLDEDLERTLGQIVSLLNDGAPPAELATAVAYAAALRLVHFPTSNDNADWDRVHHVFAYASAVDQVLRRAPSTELLRGLLDAAAAVHLVRFLNVPKRPLPTAGGERREPGDLLEVLDRQGQVDEAAQITADLLADGREAEVIATLGHALLREDAGFHSYQVFEAGVRQHANLAPRPEAANVLIGVSRFFAARFPTVRSRARTWRTAQRLHRGEDVYSEIND